MSTYSQIIKPVYIAGGASIAIGVVDQSAFAYGVSSENPSGGVYQDTLPTLTAGTTGAVRLTQYRAFHSNIRDSSGNELLGQQLMAASLPVAIASNQSTLPISAASLPLPTGAATEVTLTALSAKLPAALGQLAMAASLSVTLASDQSALPVSQSGTWNITDISGIISLPTGAATEATLSTLNGKVTACNTGAVVVSSSALPAGAATLAKQPALGTAGTASADVISIQGITSMTPVKVTQQNAGTLTDRSGSTSGTPSTSTQIAASNASRRYFFIENLDASNAIWINFTTAASAAAGSIKIPAGGGYVMEDGFCSTEAINVLAAIASVAFTAKEG